MKINIRKNIRKTLVMDKNIVTIKKKNLFNSIKQKIYIMKGRTMPFLDGIVLLLLTLIEKIFNKHLKCRF